MPASALAYWRRTYDMGIEFSHLVAAARWGRRKRRGQGVAAGGGAGEGAAGAGAKCRLFFLSVGVNALG